MTVRHAKFWFIHGYTAPERALPLFERLAKNGPQWRNAAKVQYNIGLINEGSGDYEAATRAYEVVVVSHPGTPEADEASYRRARCLARQVDDSPRNEPAYRDYPKSEHAAEARKLLDTLKERLARMYFERAEYYDRIEKKPTAALISYRDFIRNFPTSELAQQASDRIDALNTTGDKK